MTIDELFQKSPLLQEHIGKCALCGKECKLTFEHIPPKAANNAKPAKPVSFDEYIKKHNRLPWDISGMKYTNQQKGMGVFSLCQECNNNTGAYYGNEYLGFVKRAVAMIHFGVPEQCDLIEFHEVYPLRFIKQVCSMFCSINPELPYLNEMRAFVLDKESTHLNREKYRIQMYFNSGNTTKYNGYTVAIYSGLGSIGMSELVVPPFGFQLILSPNNETEYTGFDITPLSDCEYNSKVKITMPIIFNEVNSVIPNDYRSKEEIIDQIEESEKFMKEHQNE